MNHIVWEEEHYRFQVFEYEDAVRLSQEVFELALEEDAAICYQVVVDGFTVVRCFLTGTDESNIQWLERKKNTVQKSRKSSLRCGMEAEAAGRLEPWQEDREHYVIRGGGCPIWKQDGTFVGVLCISGLQHQEDHRMAAEAIRRYFDRRKENAGEGSSIDRN